MRVIQPRRRDPYDTALFSSKPTNGHAAFVPDRVHATSRGKTVVFPAEDEPLVEAESAAEGSNQNLSAEPALDAYDPAVEDEPEQVKQKSTSISIDDEDPDFGDIVDDDQEPEVTNKDPGVGESEAPAPVRVQTPAPTPSPPKTPTPAQTETSNDWYESLTFQEISKKGSRDRPENTGLATPNWIIGYFVDLHGNKSNFIERARLLGQFLYWFGKSKHGASRASRKDKVGRRCIDKTHKQLGAEVWIDRKRVGAYLQEFNDLGLIESKSNEAGSRKFTRITVLADGILKAYRVGADTARHQASKARA